MRSNWSAAPEKSCSSRWSVWNVSGKLSIPVSGETVVLSPIRIGGFSQAQASQDVAKILSFRSGLAINRHHVLRQLQWAQHQPSTHGEIVNKL